MKVHQVNPNSVKFKIDGGMVTIAGPYANCLRTLKKGTVMGMGLFTIEKATDEQVNAIMKEEVVQSSDISSSSSSSSPSLGGAKPLNGE